MRLLVTGGYGYIGGRLLPLLAARGHEVHVAARQRPAHADHCWPDTVHHAWDVRLPWPHGRRTTFDLVIHLAAANDVDSTDPGLAQAVNVDGTRHVADLCREGVAARVLYFSTFQVFGRWEGTVDEDDAPQPANEYARTHWQAEVLLRAAAERDELAYLIVRPTNLFGAPAHRDTDRWSLVPLCFCREAHETGRITLRSSGLQSRDFANVQALAAWTTDTAAAFDAHRNRTYTAGSGRAVTVRALADAVARRAAARSGRPCAVDAQSPEPRAPQALRVTGARSAAAGALPLPQAATDLDREIDLTFDRLEGR